MLSAGKSTMALHLDSTLVSPNNIIEGVVEMLACPSQSLPLVNLPYQLTIGAASKRLSQSRPTSQDRSQTD